MSDILFKCSGCELNLSVSEEMAGQSFVCPSCQATVVAPGPVLRFLCPSCCSDLSAPYEMRNELISCPGCEVGLRLPPKLILPCSQCGVNLEIEDEYYLQLAGTAVECPECGSQVVIPGIDSKTDKEPAKTSLQEELQPDKAMKKEAGQPMAQFDAGFAQKTMKLDEFMEGISQADTLREGKCPYCNTTLIKLPNHIFVCKRCNREIRTVKRKI
ncbi:MAG: hypothetical protein PHR77_16720 [Kiritimatiellae bacterium]|nr:hypothetical protein [Kiritimatiellia bacterium]MDD5520048.1 hypothetical protein [Kiritimatiellia bacterium]